MALRKINLALALSIGTIAAPLMAETKNAWQCKAGTPSLPGTVLVTAEGKTGTITFSAPVLTAYGTIPAGTLALSQSEGIVSHRIYLEDVEVVSQFVVPPSEEYSSAEMIFTADVTSGLFTLRIEMPNRDPHFSAIRALDLHLDCVSTLVTLDTLNAQECELLRTQCNQGVDEACFVVSQKCGN